MITEEEHSVLYRITGRTGSGKTEYIKTLLGEKIEQGVRCVVIVPVQQSMEYEKDVCIRFGDKANIYVEVLTFDRLPNRTYREYGKLAAEYADEGGRALLMSASLENVSERLKVFAGVCGENTFIQKMIETSRMLKENGIDHAALSALGNEDGHLAEKTREADLILSEYDSMFAHSLRDPRDVLTVYAENLKEMPFFKDKTVFIDSFNSFTEQQQRVIDAVYSQCADMYVAMCYDNDDKSDMFTNPAIAYDRLARHKKYQDIILPECARFKSPHLGYIEKNLWDGTAAPYDGKSDVSFYKCSSVFEEAEAAAYNIISLVKSGMRWRDIVVISRAPENYFGVLDTVLQKHGIPCFFSAKEDVLTKPLAVFVTSAVEAAANNFSLSSVTKLIKSGFMPVSAPEAELITRYAHTWNIRGSRWTGENEWLMNPDGFGARESANAARRLVLINNARWKISGVLKDFETQLKIAGTYAGCAKALYKLLETVDAAGQVRVKARKLRADGDDAGAQRLTQLWDIMISALEQLHDIGGDRAVTPELLLKKLELVLGTYKLGAVPAVCDSVIIGGASVFRASNPRAVILFGANDGEFPASPSVNGIFDRDEINRLAKRSIYIEDTFERQIANEKLFFYLACCSASEKLVCIYSTGGVSRESIGVSRIKALTSAHEECETSYGAKDETLVFSPASAREHSALADKEGIEYLREKGLDDSSAVKEDPLCAAEAQIDYVNEGSVQLSHSSMQRYSLCPFSYFASYVLKLAKKPESEFNAMEIGNFVHKLLQLFVSDLVSQNAHKTVDKEKIPSLVDRYADEYIINAAKGMDELPKQLVYTVGRLKKVMCLLFENAWSELSHSDFVPVEFERDMSYQYVSESGLKVNFKGVADRIDTYEKDGVTYVRIVDYKTGKKTFVKKALDFGLDAQLMVYLDVYLKQHAHPPHEPGGVNYFPAKIGSISYDKAYDEQSFEAALKGNFHRSGLYLESNEITDALENGGNGVFISAKLKKDGTYDSHATVASGKEFAKLLKKTETCLIKTAQLIAKGKMDFSPYNGRAAAARCKNGEKPPKYGACEYCDHKNVCRLTGDFSVRRGEPLVEEVGSDG